MPKYQMPRTVKGYQELVYNSFRRILGDNNVTKEWNVAKNSRDDFTRKSYSPRLDVAVGPFNIDRNLYYNNTKINKSIKIHRSFLKRMWRVSELKFDSFEEFLRNKNENPRCFLGVEIENSGSSKHMLGNIANVSIIGSIGIVIPFNEKKLSLCRRIKRYVTFATEVRKMKDVFKNVLVISKDNFLHVLNDSRET